MVFLCVTCPTDVVYVGITIQVKINAVPSEQLKIKLSFVFSKVDNHLSPTILSEYEKESQRMYLLTICPVSG